MDFDSLCQTMPEEPIKNPAHFLWHKVKKVDHYYPVLAIPRYSGRWPI